MSKDKFNDDCQGCKPAVIDVQTGKPLTPEHPIMAAVNRVWGKTTLAEREAFHKFTCLNSRDPEVMKVVQSLSERIKSAAQADLN